MPKTQDNPAAAAAALPERIAPALDSNGQPSELNPPTAGRWRRDADGGLTPADEATASAAGLAWPGPGAIEA